MLNGYVFPTWCAVKTEPPVVQQLPTAVQLSPAADKLMEELLLLSQSEEDDWPLLSEGKQAPVLDTSSGATAGACTPDACG